LVVGHDDAALKPLVKMDWLRIDDLIPVPIDPNWTGRGSWGRSAKPRSASASVPANEAATWASRT
jgi:hypothetical protein